MMDLPQFPLDRLRSVWLTRAPALVIGACLFAFGPGVLAQADSRMPPRKPGLGYGRVNAESRRWHVFDPEVI
jgi:hypothetical protein